QSSFEVEREKPSPQKAQRFADMLREADAHEPLTEDRLVELQNTVIDPRFHEFTWRSRQNWIGKDLGHRQQIDFVPARSEDLPKLMSGLLAMSSHLRDDLEETRDWEKRRTQPALRSDFVNQRYEVYVPPIDPVVAAACIAFGFVYIHPFMDGNGRIHRYLIHDTLAKAGFTPRGIVLPISAVILANLNDYIDTLEHFSKPLNRLTNYNPDAPDSPATGNDAVYFRYPDLTRQTEFLYRALERTVEHDLQEEIDFLLGFDRAYRSLDGLLDWPDHSLELFIRVVRQNGGVLSANKRKGFFSWMTEEEVIAAEALVSRAFLSNPGQSLK
ncbi:MAG TPA: Fic family protein, partial [Acidobacteriaceae bacterium]|nr:Fic family protein [Acidobacteriaceae bacterium]